MFCDACFCPTVIAQAPACVSCIASVNATLSALLGTVVSVCSSEGFGGGATATSIHALTAITSGGGSGANPCCTNSVCMSIVNAAASCVNDTCFCPTALALGSAFSHCYTTVNATISAEMSSVIFLCASEGFSMGGSISHTTVCVM